MKFNLKNRPKKGIHPNRFEEEALRTYYLEQEIWFEGFEKELRDYKKRLESANRQGHDDMMNLRLTLIAEIDDILGEEQK
jgi:hypothetical protein